MFLRLGCLKFTLSGWQSHENSLEIGHFFDAIALGDLVVDKGWAIAKDFGHLAHGYCVTSHNAEGRTVDKVFAEMSSQSFGATNQRSAYVALTRGREQAVVWTDQKAELLRAAERADRPLSVVEFAEQAVKTPKPRERLKKHFNYLCRLGSFERTHARAAAA